MKYQIISCVAGIALALQTRAMSQSVSLESAPPVVVRTQPQAGDTEVDASLKEIRVTYSKPMLDGSWSWSTWGEENYPETTGEPHYLPNGRTCVLPVRLQPHRFYAIWLNSDKFKNFKDAGGRPAVPYLLTFSTADSDSQGNVVEREVNRLVQDFPPAPDLATPEGACAAWQRASASKDVKTVSQLSLIQLDPAEQSNWYVQQEKRDPDGLSVYLKALAESRIQIVQTWRGGLANVITFLPFPEGKGSHPYSARTFGLVEGKWLNLGEDRLPDLETAKSIFANKKQRLWQHYQELKAQSTGSVPASTPGSTASTALSPLPSAGDLPGKIIFQGRYQHRSRGRDIDMPSELWVKQSQEGGLNVLARLPFGPSSELATSDATQRLTSLRQAGDPTSGRPGFSIGLELSDGLARLTRRGIRQDWNDKQLSVPQGASFDPNSRPDSYCAANILLRQFAVREGESKEFRVFDWDNSGEALVDYTIRVNHAGKVKAEVPAGTFTANHLILTQLTSADTWFKKHAGHVTEFWVLDNYVIIRVLRHREPYEMVLLDYTVPQKPMTGASFK